jgi:hypothetical protein
VSSGRACLKDESDVGSANRRRQCSRREGRVDERIEYIEQVRELVG